MKMKKLVAGLILLPGFTSPVYAHNLPFQDGIAALYHQLLGAHHLPVTLLLIIIGVALFRRIRKRVN